MDTMTENCHDCGHLFQTNVRKPVRKRYWFYKGKFDLDDYEAHDKRDIKKPLEVDEMHTKKSEGNTICSSQRNENDEVRESNSMEVVEDEELREMIRYNEREQAMLTFSPLARSGDRIKSPNGSRTSTASAFNDIDDMMVEDADKATTNRHLHANEFESKPVVQKINKRVASEDDDDLSKELHCLSSAENELRKELSVATSGSSQESKYDKQKEERKEGSAKKRKESTFHEFLSDVIDYACRGDVFSCVSWESK